MNGLITTLVIMGIIVLMISSVAIVYIALAARRRTITMKKVDYLVEDITFKSESLTSTIETVTKISNYIDVFETITKKNIKTATKLINRNKDDLYKIANRIKKLAIGKEELKNSKEGS